MTVEFFNSDYYLQKPITLSIKLMNDIQ